MRLFLTQSRDGRGRRPARSKESKAKKKVRATRTPLRLEALEDRVVPSGPSANPPNLQDPYTLYTFGDGYTRQAGMDRDAWNALHRDDGAAANSVPGTAVAVAHALSPSPAVEDPGAPGTFAVTTQEYNFGNTAFTPTGFPGVELIGEVKAPTDLGTGTHPLIVLLHGRHATTYDPITNTAYLEWPASGNHLPIPSYHGYDYLGDVLFINLFLDQS